MPCLKICSQYQATIYVRLTPESNLLNKQSKGRRNVFVILLFFSFIFVIFFFEKKAMADTSKDTLLINLFLAASQSNTPCNGDDVSRWDKRLRLK